MKSLFFTFILSVIMLTAMAQPPSGYCTVIHQPCNNDGVLAVTTTDLTPPLTFNYGGYYIHENVNSLSDTLSNFSSPIYYILVLTEHGDTALYISNTGLQYPFHAYVSLVLPECPDTMVNITTIMSGSLIDVVNWYQGDDISTGQFLGSGTSMNVSVNNGYMVEVVDTGGCVMPLSVNNGDSVTLYSLNPYTLAFEETLANCTDGSISISSITGGLPPYNYLWSNGTSSDHIDNLMTGNYTLTVTDANNCLYTYVNHVSQGVIISVNNVVNNATCQNNDGSIISFGSGGHSPYTYQWSNGVNVNTISNIPGSQHYTVLVTDDNGCIGYSSPYVSTTSPITVTHNMTPTSCSSPTGTISLNISNGTPPYSVEWSVFPIQTGTTISGLSQGYYGFTVTDNVGCKNTGNVWVANVSLIYIELSTSPAQCSGANGEITANINGNNSPFTINWSNDSIGPVCEVLQSGLYTCTVTDNVGCSQVSCAYVRNQSPVNISIATDPATCIYTADGSITAVASGGTPPYTFSWSTGAGNTSVVSGLLHGDYWCHVTDFNGCTKSKYVYLDYNHANDSCYCTITGKVYVDANTNCLFDIGETEVQNIMMHCPGYGYSFTDVNGVYSFKVPTGTYNISEVVQHIYPLAPCQTNPVSVSVVEAPACSTIVNFGNVINPLHDIKLYSTSYGHPVPGNSYNHQFRIRNAGTVTETNILFGHRDDEQLSSNYFSPAIMSQPSLMTDPGWYNNNNGSLSLAPGEWESINLSFDVPTNIPLGTIVYLNDTVAYAPPMSNWLNDYTPWNNVFDTSLVVVGSYDPNFKEVSPHGNGHEGYISENDSILTYTIHFQNTGSYFAQNIYILDTLDDNLIRSTLKPELSSHDCEISMTESGVVKFSFNGINLPWKSSYGELLSSGFVTYSVRKQTGLAPGTHIKNSASIFFDFNQPIYTNETVNTIDWPVSSEKISFDPEISVYPNPASNDVYIKTVRPVLCAGLMDISGRSVKADIILCSDGLYRMNTENLASGVYMIRCEFLNHESEFAVFCKE